MRVIYKIARLELLNLFYSPVAWLLLIFFVFMTGSDFGGSLESMSRQQEIGGWKLYAVSQTLFESRIWKKVIDLFYMIMPLLTMGLISQEFNRGSIKLLFSAPITGRHIILGKYLGMMLYGLLMVLILLAYVMIAGLFVPSFDWSFILTGLLGIYLLYGVYTAIGLFMSSLTTYQIVAALGMLALLTLLRLVSGIWQDYAFVREITYWLSISGRVDTFRNGLICTEDLFYFIILIGMFLGFAMLRIQLYREVCSFGGKVARYLGIFVVAMLLGYITSRPMMKFYHDSTYTKKNTLTRMSQDIVARLDGGLRITNYVNLFGGGYSITTSRLKQDLSRYDQYVRFKPETKIDYVFYYLTDTTTDWFHQRYPEKTLYEAAKDAAKLNGTRLSRYKNPAQINRLIDLRDEGYRFVAHIERPDGRNTFLRVFNDGLRVPSEVEISAALKRIVMRLPRVGFVSNRGGRSITGDKNRDYSYMVAEKEYRNAMINQGFDVEDVRLERGRAAIDSVDILVISEPLEPFTPTELELLREYVDSGKNLILAGKPKTKTYLEPLMDYLGLRFEPGILVQKPIDEYPASLLLCRVPESAKVTSRLWGALYNTTTVMSSPRSIVMPEAAGIERVADRGYRTFPLLVTRDPGSWNEVETIDFVNDTARLNPRVGETAGVKTTMLGLQRDHRGRDQRIVVVGDAHCFSMGEVANRRRGVGSANGNLIMAMFNWLSYEELPLNAARPPYIDNDLDMGMSTGATLEILLKWILPAILLLAAIVVLIRRKGK